MQLCAYYQATVKRADTWFMTAILRSFEHIAFDRTLDVERGVFEFYVPEAGECHFVELMNHFAQQEIITDFKKLPNRLAHPDEQL